VHLEIDMREAIAAGRFDPARDRLGLRGATPPLAWSRSLPLHEPGAPASADGIYRGWVAFPRAPRGGQPLAWKLKIDSGGGPGNEGWEPGANHSLVLDAAEVTVQRAFGAPAAPPPLRRSGQIVRHAAFASRHVAPREVQVWLPPGYDAASAQDQRYPVLYLHDGQNVFDAAAAGAEWGADEAATALVAGGEVAPMIIVAVASGSDRVAEYTPWAGGQASRSGGGGAPAYARFLVEELKPFIDNRYRTKADAANTTVGGSSLGGLVTMWLLLQHGETFGAGLVVSPSVWWADRAIVGAVAARPPRGGQRPRVWLDVGALEGEAIVDGARALRDALRSHGWGAASLAYVEDAEGSHDEASWAERLPRMLRFLYAVNPAR
jgi:predicted alpha/beta superfamily hydrolase